MAEYFYEMHRREPTAREVQHVFLSGKTSEVDERAFLFDQDPYIPARVYGQILLEVNPLLLEIAKKKGDPKTAGDVVSLEMDVNELSSTFSYKVGKGTQIASRGLLNIEARRAESEEQGAYIDLYWLGESSYTNTVETDMDNFDSLIDPDVINHFRISKDVTTFHPNNFRDDIEMEVYTDDPVDFSDLYSEYGVIIEAFPGESPRTLVTIYDTEEDLESMMEGRHSTQRILGKIEASSSKDISEVRVSLIGNLDDALSGVDVIALHGVSRNLLPEIIASTNEPPNSSRVITAGSNELREERKHPRGIDVLKVNPESDSVSHTHRLDDVSGLSSFSPSLAVINIPNSLFFSSIVKTDNESGKDVLHSSANSPLQDSEIVFIKGESFSSVKFTDHNGYMQTIGLGLTNGNKIRAERKVEGEVGYSRCLYMPNSYTREVAAHIKNKDLLVDYFTFRSRIEWSSD